MRPDSANWIATAEYDPETAQHMLATGRYIYVVFFCHLALEKMLKAHITEVTQTTPPKIHNLAPLVKASGLTIPKEYLNFLGRINSASVPTRYPEDLQRMVKAYPEAVVRDYLRQTEELVQWLRQHPNSGHEFIGTDTSLRGDAGGN
jgi:HEPN domain-containing protein